MKYTLHIKTLTRMTAFLHTHIDTIKTHIREDQKCIHIFKETSTMLSCNEPLAGKKKKKEKTLVSEFQMFYLQPVIKEKFEFCVYELFTNCLENIFTNEQIIDKWQYQIFTKLNVSQPTYHIPRRKTVMDSLK